MKKHPQKTILVTEALHHDLLVIKSMGSFKSISDAIRHYIPNQGGALHPPQ